jgi:hypothetical protein
VKNLTFSQHEVLLQCATQQHLMVHQYFTKIQCFHSHCTVVYLDLCRKNLIWYNHFKDLPSYTHTLINSSLDPKNESQWGCLLCYLLIYFRNMLQGIPYFPILIFFWQKRCKRGQIFYTNS